MHAPQVLTNMFLHIHTHTNFTPGVQGHILKPGAHWPDALSSLCFGGQDPRGAQQGSEALATGYI